MADEYKAVLTGGLSLKGGLFKSKKKNKGKRKREQAEAAARAQQDAIEDKSSATDGAEPGTSGSDSGGGKGEDGSEGEELAGDKIDDMLTPAQRRFREKQLKREGTKIRSMVEKTHRERVEDFNALLASMTEHNDIPRCSAAGNG